MQHGCHPQRCRRFSPSRARRIPRCFDDGSRRRPRAEPGGWPAARAARRGGVLEPRRRIPQSRALHGGVQHARGLRHRVHRARLLARPEDGALGAVAAPPRRRGGHGGRLRELLQEGLGNRSAPMNPKTRFNLLYVLIAVSSVFLLHDMWVRYQDVAAIPYSQFQQIVAQGKVKEVVVDADSIQGELKEPLQEAPFEGRRRFATARVSPELATSLEKSGVTFTGRVENRWLHTILSWVVPVLLFGALWMWFARRVGGPGGPGAGLMSIGKSKAKVYVETGVAVRFADVAGVDEAKAELQEVVSFLKDPTSYGRLGARMPKGVLLVGPPGTGKTLLARAVAGEAAVPFFSISGSEFVEMFVGVGAARVHDLFEQARQKAPAIIFIDELDALGRARASYPMGGGHDEKEQTLNQLLVELDGFDSSTGVVLLAATN